MRYIFVLFSLIMMYSCTETLNESPYDSTRSVTFSVDMNEAITSDIFQIGQDTLRLVLDDSYQIEMTDIDSDRIYSCVISDLIFGQTYYYSYTINDVSEELEENRFFSVQNEENIIFDYYGELNPTILIFRVHMTDQINQGNFDPNTETLDVAGTFNGWIDTWNEELQLEEDNIYTATMTDIEEGNTMEFKFRINGDWNNAEFPGYGSNRNYEIQAGENILECWYNVEGCN